MSARWRERELDVPLDQRLERPRRGPAPPRARGALGEQLLADRDQHLGEHRVLGREVLVERGPGDAARRAEVGDRDAVEAALGEEVGGDVEDLLAPRVTGQG